MPTTPNGTVYTVVNFTSSAGEAATRYVPSELADNPPLLIFVHGNPGADLNAADTQFSLSGYTPTRNWLLDHGYVMGECHGGGANWGGQAGRVAYAALFADLDALYDVGDVVVIGRSMGGIIGTWLASQHGPVASKCIGFICLSGLMDLHLRYTQSPAGNLYRTHMSLAYGGSGESGSELSNAAFAVASAAHDPMKVEPSGWAGRNAIQQYDTGDATVPYLEHAAAWRTKYGSVLGRNDYCETSGGDHNSTPNSLTQQAATLAFIDAVMPVPPEPVDPIVRRIAEMFMVGGGGALYPMSPGAD